MKGPNRQKFNLEYPVASPCFMKRKWTTGCAVRFASIAASSLTAGADSAGTGRTGEGTLYSLVYGRPSALQLDPVEKEPLHHFLPGSEIYCIGTAGCNFRCKFCHNWHLSQRSIEELGSFYEHSPEEAVRAARKQHGAPTISFTYNEPTVFYEYVYDVATEAKKQGLRIIFHSNGSMNPEPLRALLPQVDAVTRPPQSRYRYYRYSLLMKGFS